MRVLGDSKQQKGVSQLIADREGLSSISQEVVEMNGWMSEGVSLENLSPGPLGARDRVLSFLFVRVGTTLREKKKKEKKEREEETKRFRG